MAPPPLKKNHLRSTSTSSSRGGARVARPVVSRHGNQTSGLTLERFAQGKKNNAPDSRGATSKRKRLDKAVLLRKYRQTQAKDAAREVVTTNEIAASESREDHPSLLGKRTSFYDQVRRRQHSSSPFRVLA